MSSGPLNQRETILGYLDTIGARRDSIVTLDRARRLELERLSLRSERPRAAPRRIGRDLYAASAGAGPGVPVRCGYHQVNR